MMSFSCLSAIVTSGDLKKKKEENKEKKERKKVSLS